jgi:hypothetical protein
LRGERKKEKEKEKEREGETGGDHESLNDFLSQHVPVHTFPVLDDKFA